ncbi:hypothetical protein PYCCODRAFT_1439379 [Trametes coccinea BRFM310]|uniref:F-box domain-containing protein n=1 Tax=Trametes coccinea (strain BRFM310) TaxID=1353009 RepID=A0A1Y2IB85_TRAC3|nr:hypothetical protein PYCCODRAFT_1439379 [Trametes coccinea BRFM310]
MKRRKRTSNTVDRERETIKVPTSAIGLHSLPLEVWHIVLENAPKPTLLACSRLSRAWRELALPHLFASFDLCQNSGNVADICEEFIDAYPHLARYIRRLRLVRRDRWFMVSSNGRPVMVDHNLLVTLLTRLPCLEEVYLRSLGISTASQPRSLDVPLSRRLKKLHVVDCYDAGSGNTSSTDLRTLLDLAGAVPVEIIQFEMFSVERRKDKPVTTPSLRLLDPRAFQFDMRCDVYYRRDQDLSWVCDVLRAAFAPRCLTSLRMSQWILGGDIDALRRLGRFIAHACSRTMQHLSLPVMINSAVASAHDTSDKEEFWRVLHLHRFDSIETFECSLALPALGTNPGSDGAPRVPLSAVCVAILALLPSTLRKVTIILWEAKEGSQVKSKWLLDLGALDVALEARAPVLETVRLVFHGDWYLIEFATEATKAMSRCKKRGMFEVVDWFYHTREMQTA